MKQQFNLKRFSINIIVYTILIVGYILLYNPDTQTKSTSKTEFVYQQF